MSNNLFSKLFKILLALVLIRFVMIVITLTLMVPKQETQHSETQDKGKIRIEISWESFKDVDVDLWAKAPGDRAVGFPAPHSKVFDLVRDDVGNLSNPTGAHYEIMYARDNPSGEYIVNVHLYNNREMNYHDVPVFVSVYYAPDTRYFERVLYKKVILHDINEELTVFRFTINKNKEIDKNSVNDIEISLIAENRGMRR
jgi:hypothetical protein